MKSEVESHFPFQHNLRRRKQEVLNVRGYCPTVFNQLLLLAPTQEATAPSRHREPPILDEAQASGSSSFLQSQERCRGIVQDPLHL